MKPQKSLINELDRCVMCGLCLPRCPTYQLTNNEAESPRGRISLIKAIEKEQLALDSKLTEHLDNCLSCRACESVCPSAVNYGYIIDKARERIHSSATSNSALANFASHHIVAKRSRLRLAAVALWFYQLIGLQHVVRATKLIASHPRLQRLHDYLPPKQTPALWKNYYPSRTKHIKDVALFLGCASESIDPNTLRASIKLLTQLGYGVHIPQQQNCCGALHQHQGQTHIAEQLVAQNNTAFTSSQYGDVISVASGCTSMLHEYPEYLVQPPQWKPQDILDFLIKEKALANAEFQPLHKTIAIHTPCSMTNVLKLKQTAHQCLNVITGLTLTSLSSNNLCCGAAGSYMLSHPTNADTLLNYKLDDIHDITPDIVCSNNIGCALHLSAGLRKHEQPIPVLHPVEILAKQLIAH